MKYNNRFFQIIPFISLFILFSNYIKGQIVITNQGIGFIENCSLSLSCPSFSYSTRLSYHPNGKIYGIQNTASPDSFVIIEFDAQLCTSTYIADCPVSFPNLFAFQIDYKGNFYVLGSDSPSSNVLKWFQFSLSNLKPVVIRDTVRSDFIYSLYYNGYLYNWGVFSDSIEVLDDSFIQTSKIPKEKNIIGVIVNYISCDSSNLSALVFKYNNESNKPFKYFYYRFNHATGKLTDSICEIDNTSLSLISIRSFGEVASSEPNCKLRIDLDKDNSSGLYPYDFLVSAVTCDGTLQPIADYDIDVRANNLIDSILLTISPYSNQELKSSLLPEGMSLQPLNHGRYKLIKNGGHFNEYKSALSNIVFDAKSFEGESKISIIAYMYNEKSPEASAFIRSGIRANSGRDTVLIFCKGSYPNLFLYTFLDASALRNGTWKMTPGMQIIGDTLQYFADTTIQLLYITGNSLCGFDTASIIIQRSNTSATIEPRTLNGKRGAKYPITVKSNVKNYSVIWSPHDWISCDTCHHTMALLHKEGFLYAEVYDEMECIARDSIPIIIVASDSIFIPNVINLRSTAGNSMFRLYTKQGLEANILSATIYNRWGGIVHRNFKFDIRDVVWDGRYRNKEVQPGVYVYRINIKFKDGRIETFIGELIVI